MLMLGSVGRTSAAAGHSQGAQMAWQHAIGQAGSKAPLSQIIELPHVASRQSAFLLSGPPWITSLRSQDSASQLFTSHGLCVLLCT